MHLGHLQNLEKKNAHGLEIAAKTTACDFVWEQIWMQSTVEFIGKTSAIFQQKHESRVILKFYFKLALAKANILMSSQVAREHSRPAFFVNLIQKWRKIQHAMF